MVSEYLVARIQHDTAFDASIKHSTAIGSSRAEHDVVMRIQRQRIAAAPNDLIINMHVTASTGSQRHIAVGQVTAKCGTRNITTI